MQGSVEHAVHALFCMSHSYGADNWLTSDVDPAGCVPLTQSFVMFPRGIPPACWSALLPVQFAHPIMQPWLKYRHG